MLPNPVYGTALKGEFDDVFPADKRWNDAGGEGDEVDVVDRGSGGAGRPRFRPGSQQSRPRWDRPGHPRRLRGHLRPAGAKARLRSHALPVRDQRVASRHHPRRGLRGGTLEDYIAKSGPILEKEGFTEHELGRRVELYGNLATVWSSYDGRTASGSFHERGINSFQLVKVDGKWLVASILWQEEGKQFPLPKDMIRKR